MATVRTRSCLLRSVIKSLALHLMRSWSVSRGAAACLLWALAASQARATGAEPARDLQVDPSPCVAAAASHEDDKSIEVCGALIDNEKTAKADRVKALIARGERLCAQGHDRPRHRRLRPRAAARSCAGRCLQRPRRALAQEGRPGESAFRFRRRAQAEPRSRGGQGQLQIAGAGTGEDRRADGGRGQAELQLRQGPPRGGKGDLRQPRACRSRPRDQCDEHPGYRRSEKSPAKPERCSASRMPLSPAAMPSSAGRATICARP